MKQDVRKLTFDKLKDYVLETELLAFCAKKIWEWIWVKSAYAFEEMSNLIIDAHTIGQRFCCFSDLSADRSNTEESKHRNLSLLVFT